MGILSFGGRRRAAFFVAAVAVAAAICGCRRAEAGARPGAAGGSATVTRVDEPSAERVVLGDEQFGEFLPLLEGRRVALLSNHSGIVGDKILLSDGTERHGGFTAADVPEGVDFSLVKFGRDAVGNPVSYGEHILDALISRGVDVRAVFCPEHGFRGDADAGADIEGGVDSRTGVPLLSLYGGGSRAPSAEDMAKFDVLVVDLQDVGLRFYTYYIALVDMMEACAASGKDVVVLDRPNPNGFYVDGPLLSVGYESGVGRLPIPVVHGLTFGELARMANGEGWLPSGRDSCRLTVVPCANYAHGTKYSLVRAPSPNLRDMRAVYLYPSTCLFENTLVSVGRGTDFPFEAFGGPVLEGAAEFPFSFTPESVAGAANPPFLGERCFGEDLRGKPLSEILAAGIDLSYISRAYSAAAPVVKRSGGDFFGKPDARGRYWLDLLSGSDLLRKGLVAGRMPAEMREGWRGDVKSFLARRRPYLLYPEGDGLGQWQVDATFPDWTSAENFAARGSLSFRSFRGQGRAFVTVGGGCGSFSMFVNGRAVDTGGMACGSTYEVDFSPLSENGLNSLQVSGVSSGSVRVRIPFPEVVEGRAEDSGISAEAFDVIDRIVSADVSRGFPGAQVAVVKDGRLVWRKSWGIVRDGGPAVDDETLFDLASVTKMLGGNFAVQSLVSKGLLSLDARVVDILGERFAEDTVSIPFTIWPRFPLERMKEWKRRLTVRDLLVHSAGFAPLHPYHNDGCDVSRGEFNAGRGRNPLLSGAGGGWDVRERTLAQICRTPLVYEPGTMMKYSDIDFMLLGFIAEKVGGRRLDGYIRTEFLGPLGLSRTAYRPLDNGFSADDCAATTLCGDTREGALSFTGARTGLVQGVVHDEAAFHALAGVSGHAGLFASATDAAVLASLMLTGGSGRRAFFTRNVVDSFTAPNSVRFADYGLGWWRQGDFQTVRNFGSACSSSAFGHQGFTGTLVFVEPERNLVVAYLTDKIRTPMVAGEELSGKFEGGFYQSGVPGFVPQVLLMGMEAGADRSRWKAFLGGMADSARRFAEIEAGADRGDPRWRAAESLAEVFEGY